MMWLTSIDVTTSSGEVQTHEGPIITANTYEEAQEEAIKMNSELTIVGEYIDSIGNGYGLELFKF